VLPNTKTQSQIFSKTDRRILEISEETARYFVMKNKLAYYFYNFILKYLLGSFIVLSAVGTLGVLTFLLFNPTFMLNAIAMKICSSVVFAVAAILLPVIDRFFNQTEVPPKYEMSSKEPMTVSSLSPIVDVKHEDILNAIRNHQRIFALLTISDSIPVADSSESIKIDSASTSLVKTFVSLLYATLLFNIGRNPVVTQNFIDYVQNDLNHVLENSNPKERQIILFLLANIFIHLPIESQTRQTIEIFQIDEFVADENRKQNNLYKFLRIIGWISTVVAISSVVLSVIMAAGVTNIIISSLATSFLIFYDIFFWRLGSLRDLKESNSHYELKSRVRFFQNNVEPQVRNLPRGTNFSLESPLLQQS
jgi:hypothetical protein